MKIMFQFLVKILKFLIPIIISFLYLFFFYVLSYIVVKWLNSILIAFNSLVYTHNYPVVKSIISAIAMSSVYNGLLLHATFMHSFAVRLFLFVIIFGYIFLVLYFPNNLYRNFVNVVNFFITRPLVLVISLYLIYLLYNFFL